VQVIIDVLKHAVLGKWNDVRPGLYREYMKVRGWGDGCTGCWGGVVAWGLPWEGA